MIRPTLNATIINLSQPKPNTNWWKNSSRIFSNTVRLTDYSTGLVNQISGDHAKERERMVKRNTVDICGLYARRWENSWSNRRIKFQHIGTISRTRLILSLLVMPENLQPKKIMHRERDFCNSWLTSCIIEWSVCQSVLLCRWTDFGTWFPCIRSLAFSHQMLQWRHYRFDEAHALHTKTYTSGYYWLCWPFHISEWHSKISRHIPQYQRNGHWPW